MSEHSELDRFALALTALVDGPGSVAQVLRQTGADSLRRELLERAKRDAAEAARGRTTWQATGRLLGSDEV